MHVKGKKVYVGLSGGVDSAVSAALLKQSGADVIGVFIKGWYPPGMPCTWAEDRRDAMRVAAHLGIPFRTLDAARQYKESVIDYLLDEYRVGRTPNPDVMCNREIKFGVFYRYAMDHGADLIATGHYTRGEKDQQYFLWAVPKEVIDRTVFPVGHMEKSAVRQIAYRLKLPVAEKKDSQGVCFLGSISIDEFLVQEFGNKPGRAVTEEGREIGMHSGALLHTIGERVSLQGAEEIGPWFVQGKNIESNILILSKSQRPSPSTAHAIPFEKAVWQDPAQKSTSAQYRYRGPHIEGHVEGSIFVAKAPLPEPPASGQSLVFYDGAELVGGAIIS